MNKFYITSAIPYVNAKPHIGHALEFIQADTIARYHRVSGDAVRLLSGGDENALKNVQAAESSHKPIQTFIDENNQLFEDLTKKLNCSYDIWQRGSSNQHHQSVQKLWRLCDENGDIYKKTYKGLYCVGCEQFYTKEELNENGECFEHPGKKLEEIEEENYFFRLSAYQDKLIKLIESNQYEIVPDFRKNEIISFLKSGLQDLSISRSNTRAKNWGVSVPEDPNQKIYVWFDALNIYQSGVGFGWDETLYTTWWPADIHVIGKGIIRFHAVYWPAILLSAKLPLPKKLFVHEYFTVEGQKMSKTLGNVYDPLKAIAKVGTDGLRYYCLAKISPFQDGDFSEEKLIESYNSDLANGLGNLVARVARLAEKNEITVTNSPTTFSPPLQQVFTSYKFNEGIAFIWSKIAEADKLISDTRPWEKDKAEATPVLEKLADSILQIGFDLQPFLPQTAQKILNQFQGRIQSSNPLFPRLNDERNL